jgi:hypothetical protein
MKTPHIPVRSIDLSTPGAFFKTRAPKRNETRFVSKLRPSLLCDEDIKPKRVRTPKEKIEREIKQFSGKTNKDGSFSIPRRENGKFAAPLVFDASLMAKLSK